MFSFQTIISDIDTLVSKDDEGNFIQTDFDSEVESFIDSLLVDKKMVRQISFFTAGSKLISVISFSEMSYKEISGRKAQKAKAVPPGKLQCRLRFSYRACIPPLSAHRASPS